MEEAAEARRDLNVVYVLRKGSNSQRKVADSGERQAQMKSGLRRGMALGSGSLT